MKGPIGPKTDLGNTLRDVTNQHVASGEAWGMGTKNNMRQRHRSNNTYRAPPAPYPPMPRVAPSSCQAAYSPEAAAVNAQHAPVNIPLPRSNFFPAGPSPSANHPFTDRGIMSLSRDVNWGTSTPQGLPTQPPPAPPRLSHQDHRWNVHCDGQQVNSGATHEPPKDQWQQVTTGRDCNNNDQNRQNCGGMNPLNPCTNQSALRTPSTPPPPPPPAPYPPLPSYAPAPLPGAWSPTEGGPGHQECGAPRFPGAAVVLPLERGPQGGSSRPSDKDWLPPPPPPPAPYRQHPTQLNGPIVRSEHTTPGDTFQTPKSNAYGENSRSGGPHYRSSPGDRAANHGHHHHHVELPPLPPPGTVERHYTAAVGRARRQGHFSNGSSGSGCSGRARESSRASAHGDRGIVGVPGHYAPATPKDRNSVDSDLSRHRSADDRDRNASHRAPDRRGVRWSDGGLPVRQRRDRNRVADDSSDAGSSRSRGRGDHRDRPGDRDDEGSIRKGTSCPPPDVQERRSRGGSEQDTSRVNDENDALTEITNKINALELDAANKCTVQKGEVLSASKPYLTLEEYKKAQEAGDVEYKGKKSVDDMYAAGRAYNPTSRRWIKVENEQRKADVENAPALKASVEMLENTVKLLTQRSQLLATKADILKEQSERPTAWEVSSGFVDMFGVFIVPECLIAEQKFFQVSDEPIVTLATPAAPKLVAFDTNCFIHALPDTKCRIADIAGHHPDTSILVPKAVLAELDGLKKNDVTSFNARGASRFLKTLLESHPDRKFPVVRFQEDTELFRDDGHHKNPVYLRGDASILNCCMFFAQSIKTPRQVTLVTGDNNFEMLARANRLRVEGRPRCLGDQCRMPLCPAHVFSGR